MRIMHPIFFYIHTFWRSGHTMVHSCSNFEIQSNEVMPFKPFDKVLQFSF